MKNLIAIPRRLNNFLKSYWLAEPAMGIRRIIIIYLSLFSILGIGALFKDYLLIILVISGGIGLGAYFLVKLRKYGYHHRWYSKGGAKRPVEIVDLFLGSGRLLKRQKKFPVPVYQKIFKSKRGKETIFRFPSENDLENFMKFSNKMIREKNLSLERTIYWRKEEAERRLKNELREIKERKGFSIFVFHDEKMIAQGKITRRGGKRAHSGKITEVNVEKNFRKEGIGTALMKELVFWSKKFWNLKLIRLDVVSGNLPAINAYKKIGFKISGKIPKVFLHRGRYYDLLIMIKSLK